MENTQEQESELQVVFVQDHPWLEIGDDMDEDIRYSLDEIRFA